MLVDANLLLFAVDARSPYHRRAAGWLTEQLHGLTVYSSDTDFARFEEIRWIDPLAS